MQRAKIISEALIHRLELEAAKMVDKPTVRVGELGDVEEAGPSMPGC